jgi:hypothetical protein
VQQQARIKTIQMKDYTFFSNHPKTFSDCTHTTVQLPSRALEFTHWLQIKIFTATMAHHVQTSTTSAYLSTMKTAGIIQRSKFAMIFPKTVLSSHAFAVPHKLSETANLTL